MHTLTNLRTVTTHEWANECASSPFLHVCALDKDDLERVLANALITVPDDPRRNPNTIQAEAALKIPPSVYFFVGRCYPTRVGTIAVALEWHDLEADEGAVSPFDTGGIYHEYSLLPWSNVDPGTKRGYVETHSAPLSEFGEYFASFLSSFFNEAQSYWKHPDAAIDGVVLRDPKDWRNWTFEVRVREHVGVADAKWYFSPEADSDYVDLVEEGRIDPLPDSRYEVATKPFDKAEADALMRCPD